MGLRHAVLASLLTGEGSGYELAKRMDSSVANFWTASRQQIYMELARLEEQKLVVAREVPQQGRPDKRLFSVTAHGLAELSAFIERPTPPTTIRDELLVKVQAADFVRRATVANALDQRRAEAQARLEVFDGLLAHYRAGKSEEDYLESATRVGPYLNLRRGRDFEAENIVWYEWAAEVLRRRGDRRRARLPRLAGPST